MQKITVFSPDAVKELKRQRDVADKMYSETERSIKRLQSEAKKYEERVKLINQLLHIAELLEDKSTEEIWEEQKAEQAALSTS